MVDKALLAERLQALQTCLHEADLDGFIVPRGDAHMGEYVPACDERLAWLTGFTGSAGTAVVLGEQAAVFVDGRYTLQAPEQVSPQWQVINIADKKADDWAASVVKPGHKLGFDPHLMAAGAEDVWRKKLFAAGAQLVAVAGNPVDALWTQGRPARPSAPVTVHGEDVAGKASALKRAEVAAALQEKTLAAFLISAPESVAWLLNVRGGDLAHTPVALAFALMHDCGAVDLMIDATKVSADVQAHLGDGVRLYTYGGLEEVLAARGWADGARVGIDRTAGSTHARDAIQSAGLVPVIAEDPCALPKAIKNDVELAGIKAAHRRDGAALCRFLAWLDEVAPAGDQTEISVSDKLEGFRRDDPTFHSTSFSTISGAGPNGAIVHYSATPDTDRSLSVGDVYLVDSGGQYPDGTTDVTRTVVVGDNAPEAARDAFTRVLKGHIALACARFAPGTTGAGLDVLARAPLWEVGLDFDHGTGHGVGAFLSVHEGPQYIARREGGPALVPGMVLSNEPGYYRAGEFGIRIENLVAVRTSELTNAERPMLEFETLTLAPIDRRMIVPALLTDDETNWLNAYHARVLAEIAPLVDDDTQQWLATACAAI